MNTTTIKPGKPSCKLYIDELSKENEEFTTTVVSSFFLIASITVIFGVWLMQSDVKIKNILMYTGISLLVALIIITMRFVVMKRREPKFSDCTYEDD